MPEWFVLRTRNVHSVASCTYGTDRDKYLRLYLVSNVRSTYLWNADNIAKFTLCNFTSVLVKISTLPLGEKTVRRQQFNVVCIVTWIRGSNSGFQISVGQETFVNCAQQLCGPSCLPSNVYLGSFTGGNSARPWNWPLNSNWFGR